MPIIKRLNRYQGLRDIDVFINEKNNQSEYFNVTGLPNEIPQGKSSFLVGGSPYLKNNIEIKIEIIDSAGKTVYMEPVPNYLEGGARRVSIEVYPDTSPGIAKLYILGELKPNYQDFIQPPVSNDEITDVPFTGAGGPPPLQFTNQAQPDVPEEFQGIYNIRTEIPIFINTSITNTEPIFFYKQPRLTVNEIVKGFVTETIPSSSYEVSGTIQINPISDPPVEPPPPVPEDGQPVGMTESDRNDVGKQLAIFKNRRSKKRDPYRSTLFGKRGRKMRRSSPEIDKSTGIILTANTTPETAENTIHSGFVGADITFTNITSDVSSLGGQPYDFENTFTTKVKKVVNNTTLIPMDDYKVTLMNGEKVQVPITSANFSCSIAPTPGFVISETEFRSFADITIGNLRTFSGDVYKAQVYGKSQGSLGDFEPMYDAFIESSEVLIDKLSPTGFSSTAYFYTQSIVDAYWNITDGTAIESDDVLIDGVTISGSNYTKSGTTKFTTKHLYDLEPNVAYNVEFNAYYYKADKQQADGSIEQQAIMNVYVTGSKSGDKELLGAVNVGEGSEGQIDSIFKTFISSNIAEPKMALEFHVVAGKFILQDLSVRPTSETNFNPDYHRVIVPMPHPLPVKPDNYNFVVEFFDVNNNIAETFAVTENVEFDGAPIVIAGDGNILSGSMLLGSGMELYGGSAFLRTVGYTGFDNTLSGGKGGFMVFSGSIGGPSAPENLISSSEDYDGVGLEIIDAHTANNPRYLRFGTNPSRFEVVTDTFYFGKQRNQANAQFVSGSNGQIEISSSNFHVSTSGDVKMSGTVTATAGKIAGWNIIGNVLSGSNATLDAAGAALYMSNKGPGSDDSAAFDQLRDEYYIDFTPADQGNTTNYHIKMGPNFAVDSTGVLFASGAKFVGTITASAGLIGGWAIENDYMGSVPDGLRLYGNTAASIYHISSSAFKVTNTGQITGSEVLFTGGKIAGYTINGNTLSATNFILDAGNSKITLGSNDDIFIADVNTGIQLGHATFGSAPFSVTKGGVLKAESGTVGGFTLSGTQLKGGSGGTTVALTPGAGIHAGADLLNAAPFSVTNVGVLKAESGTVGGWELATESLIGGDMVIRKDGTIESSGFASDVAGSGFRLTAASGGFLEVENARIRGTLSTAVFEKESVNAVGGQLYVANSTVLTGSLRYPSGVHTAAQTTMSVVNASGFVAGEILTIKKVHQTGFNTEYLLVASSSRVSASSETDFTGHLYVTRGYGQGVSGDSGSLGGVAGSATHYSGSQVVVSTGRIGTGYIRLNANPSDQATPYIDIVERTGSGLYDINLQARLGDLSGLSSARLHGTNPTGQYGLYSKNVFLEGGIVANTGSIAGIEMSSGKLFTGPPTHGGATTGFYVDNAGNFSLKDKLVWNGSTLTIKGAIRQTAAGSTITDFVDRGTWAASNNYAVNDLVQYTGTTTSTYKCINSHTSTNNTSNTTGRPDVNNGSGTNGWAIYAAGGVDGTNGTDGNDGATGATGPQGATGNTGPAGSNGSDAQNISLASTAQSFRVDQDGTITPAFISFTSSLQNISGNPTYTTSPSVTLTAGSNGKLKRLTSGNFGSNNSVQVNSEAGGITDSITVVKLTEGSDALTIINTNQAHVLPSNSSGVVSDYSNSGTTIQVFEGATQLDYDASGGTAGHWTVSVTQSPSSTITIGSVDESGDNVVIQNHSAMVNTTDAVSITYAISGKRLNGEAFSVNSVQTLTKSKAGIQGVTGAAGASGSDGAGARAVNLTTATQAFTYNTSGTTPSPADTTITATAVNTGSNNVYYEFFEDDSSVQNTTSNTYTYTPEANFTNMPDVIEVQIREDSNSGTILARDQLTIVGVKPGADGEDGFTVLLSNESHTVPQTSPQAGAAFNFAGSGTNITVFKGTTQQAGIVSGTANAGQFLVSRAASGVTAASLSAGTPATIGNLTGMSADTGTITYTITPHGASAITKVQSFSKSQAADSGSDGTDGTSPANLSISTSTQVFSFDDSSDTSPDPTTATITATQANQASNLENGDLSVTNSTKSSFNYSGTNGTGTATWTVTPSGTYPITATISNDSLSDTIKMHKIVGGADGDPGAPGADGEDAFTIILSNESHIVPQNSTQAGSAFDFVGSGTNITVFKGLTALTGITSGTPTSTQYLISKAVSNVTVADPTGGNPTVSPNISGLSANSGSITFTITPSGSSAFTKVQSFTKSQAADSGSDGDPGTPGTSPRTVSLTAPNFVIAYDANGSNPSPSGTLTLTATSQNFTNGFFKFTGDGLTDETSYINGSGDNADTFSYTIPTSHFATPKSIRVGVADGDQNEVAFDTMTLSAIKPGLAGASGSDGAAGSDGVDAYTVVLTNESHTIPRASNQAGGAYTLTNSGTRIIVFRGVTQLTGITSGSPITGQFLVGAPSATGVTAGGRSIDGTDNKTMIVADLTGPSSSTNITEGSLNFTVNAEGSASFTKLQSFTVAQGADSGSDGSSAKSVRLSSDAQSFITSDGSMTPTTITFTANRQNISSATSFSSSPSVTLGGSGDTATLTSASFGNNTSVTITATADSISDSITIVKLTEGSDGFTVLLSNESHNVTQASPQAGSAHDFTGSGTNITVFKGTVQQAGIVSGTPNAGQFLVSKTQTGVTSATPQAGTPVTVGNLTGMSADIGNITYTITPHGSSAFTKIQSFTRTTAADSGSDGDTGPAGPTGPDGTPGATGSAGAGVTFTGPWESGKVYNGGSAIKDIVKYTPLGQSEGFFIATSDHTSTNNNNSSTGRPGDGGPWETFGAQFSSVATDILLAQDSTITRGLVMGSADPASSTGGAFIRSINKTALATGNGDGFFLSSSGDFSFEKVNDSRVQLDSDGIEISSSKFHLKDNGDLIVSKVDATEGDIGGFSISDTTLSSTTTQGFLQLKKAVDKTTTAITAGPTIVSNPDEGRFLVKYNGQFTGSRFKAEGGEIGGFSLTNGNLKSTNFVISGSGGGKLKTAETGRRVEIDGNDNSLRFFDSAKSDAVIEFSDSLTTYVLAPGFNLPNSGVYSYSGIDLNEGSLIITPDETDEFVGVGIKMPIGSNNGSGTEDDGDFLGFGVTYGGPASLSIYSSGTQMGSAYTLYNIGSGETIGSYYSIGAHGGGALTGVKVNLEKPPEHAANGSGAGVVKGIHICEPSTATSRIISTDIIHGMHVELSSTSSYSVGSNPSATSVSYGLLIENNVKYSVNQNYALNYGIVSTAPHNRFDGEVVIGTPSDIIAGANSRPLYVAGDAIVTGEMEVSGDIDLNGNLIGDNSSTISGINSISATSLTATGTVQAEHLYTTDDLQVTGDIDLNGNLIGDDATDITNIESIYCVYVRAAADGTNNYINFADNEISIVAGGAERLSVQDNTVIINEGGVDINFRVESEDQPSMLSIDGHNNTVGIGTSGLRTFHAVMDLAAEAGTPGSYSAYNGPLWERSRASGTGATDWIGANLNTSTLRQSILGPSAYDDNIYFYFRDDGTENSQYVVVIDGSANNFTGQHTVNIVSGSSLLNVDWKGAPQDQLGISGSNINEFAGKIVYATGDYQRWCRVKRQYVSGSEALEINEALPLVDMTSTNTDKRVFGVISDREDRLRKDNDSGDYENDWQMVSGSNGGAQINAAFNFGNLKPGKIRVNSIGEGSIWVCNMSGSLSNGDYITTCNVPGYGAKQNDDLLHNYTVAKITTDCDFTTGNYKTGSIEHNGVTYKTAFVGCTYHCG